MASRFDKELVFADYLGLVLRNKLPLLFCVGAFLLPTLWFTSRIPDYFTASAQIVMDKKPQSLMVMEDESQQKNLGYYQAIFRSQAFLDRLLHAMEPQLPPDMGPAAKRRLVEEKVALLEGSITSFIRVESQTPSPALSFALAKAATESLIVFSRRLENEEAEKAIAAIKEQIEFCVKKRDEIQAEKSRYTDISKLASLGDLEGLAALEKSYQEELVKYELDKANFSAQKSYFRSLDSAVNRDRGDGSDSVLGEYRRQLRALEKEKEKMLRLGISLTPTSPLNLDIQALEEKIVRGSRRAEGQDFNTLNQWQALRKDVSTTQSDLQLKKARLDAFRQAILAYREAHPDIGKREYEVQQLENLLERFTSAHKRLTERLEDETIRMHAQSGGLKLVDAPQPPTVPIPRKDYIYYLIAVFAGLAFGIGFSLFREFMDDTIKSPDDVEKRLALTLLGTIPHITVKKSDLELERSSAKGKNKTTVNRYPELILKESGEESVSAESYRSLRTNIVFTSPDKAVQSLLITSSGPGEGKSLTMANTALTFAQQGEPTIIIDTDLRRPVCHHLFGLSRGPGFGDLFSGSIGLDEAVRELPGTSLKIITAGAHIPNPSELLGSKKMDHILVELKKRFRYILFDTPPVMAVTDACILATKLDGVIVVTRSSKTSLAVAERTLQSLRNVKAKVLGCILNDVDLSQGHSSYGYYKHYYHYYRTRKD